MTERTDPSIAQIAAALARTGKADLIALAPSLAAAIHRSASVGSSWIDPAVLTAFQAQGINLGKNTYYSIVPSLRDLPPELWEGQPFARAWSEVSVEDPPPLLAAILHWAQELRALPRRAASGFCWDNPMFPPLDAIAYYGLIRERRPRRILEVGSGFSTHIALLATERNGGGEVSCIEPYPGAGLLAVESRLAGLTRAPVQKVPDAVFRGIGPGDILFIDTSHALKTGSDVNHILFNLLPLVQPGALIHFHDIFLPCEYPRHWFYEIGILWNEQYALLAFLMNNPSYRVVLANWLASQQHAAALHTALKEFDIWEVTQNLGGARGASLWIEKQVPSCADQRAK